MTLSNMPRILPIKVKPCEEWLHYPTSESALTHCWPLMKFMDLVGLCDFSEPSEKHPKIFQRMHDSRGGMKQGFCLCFWKRSLFFLKKKSLFLTWNRYYCAFQCHCGYLYCVSRNPMSFVSSNNANLSCLILRISLGTSMPVSRWISS